MTRVAAYRISLTLNLAAFRCLCGLEDTPICPQCECLWPWRTPCWPTMIGVCCSRTGRCVVSWTDMTRTERECRWLIVLAFWEWHLECYLPRPLVAWYARDIGLDPTEVFP